MASNKPSTKLNYTATQAALFGVGLALGYTYYAKKYKPFHKPQARSKPPQAPITIQLNTANVTLPKEIDEYFSVALQAAIEAGELIKQFINDTQSKSDALLTKSNHADIVTQIDKKCEHIILSKIKSSFPDHRIIAEESCKDPSTHHITNAPTWFVDPIDGTTNFFHGLPLVCVCIGLRINKVPILGVVHCPILEETFHAVWTRGAFMIDHRTNQTNRIRTNSMRFDNKESIKRALVLTEPTYDRTEKWVQCLNRRLYDLLYKEKVRAIRMLGCCGIDMCWVAMGRADIFYEGRNNASGPKPWDFTAGEIIVYEAGGVTCDPEGKAFDCTQGRILCCNDVDTAKYIINCGLYKESDR
eukprot:214907_1